ncbi:MAG TPA: helical backbone metal receptor [Chitinophagaceae bacterium]|nr:helical backbone metal receptor [Chitinophagaceae bacterium]
MFTVVDQAERIVVMNTWPPKRIVSLVPSQTELLHYLGLENEVVGITKFCVHPESWFSTKQRIGGTKTVHIDAVKALKPDIILANKEENVKEQIEALEEIAPVWVSDVNTFEAALQMITEVGEIVDKLFEAETLRQEILRRFAVLPGPGRLLENGLPVNIAYLIWREPYMTVGGDTFINDMIKLAGCRNVFENEERYPQIELEQISQLHCRYVFLSSEPYPFKPKHAEEIRNTLPGIDIIFVDGEMFSWYGSRLLQAAQYLKELNQRLNPMPGEEHWV